MTAVPGASAYPEQLRDLRDAILAELDADAPGDGLTDAHAAVRISYLCVALNELDAAIHRQDAGWARATDFTEAT